VHDGRLELPAQRGNRGALAKVLSPRKVERDDLDAIVRELLEPRVRRSWRTEHRGDAHDMPIAGVSTGECAHDTLQSADRTGRDQMNDRERLIGAHVPLVRQAQRPSSTILL
jgi:hypothetical protein